MNNKTNVVRIFAAVVDTRQLTLYKENGEEIIIMQGDPRLRKILEDATPQLVRQNWADVEISQVKNSTFADFEKASGTIKFFRVAKSALKKLFGEDEPEEVPDISPVLEMSIGHVPVKAQHVTMEAVPASLVSDAAEAIEQFGEDELERFRDEQLTKANQPSEAETKMTNVVNEILANAVSVTSPEYHERTVAEQGELVDGNGKTDNQRTGGEHENMVDSKPDTIVAVVGNRIIPGMERIKTQFDRAAKLGSTAGVEKFLERLAAVIDKRNHSVDDLLKFMERGDLPIADDGSILIYKVLNRKGSRTDGKYVDVYSKKVEQFTGAYVCMDPSMVDHNRRTECSNGLHVARRGYIREFGGDVCVLCKLAPEDVIAVPEYDANKMRVCGYHILIELSDAQYALLKKNRPITDDEEGKRLLGNAMAGKHIRRTHEVRITEAGGGGGVVVKALDIIESPKPERTTDAPHKVEALAGPLDSVKVAPTDPLEVVKSVEVETQAVQLSRKEQAKVLYDACAGGGKTALDALHAFKKSSKTSWEKLGLPDLNGSTFSIRDDKATSMMKGKNYAKKVKKLETEKKSKNQTKPLKTKQVKGDYWEEGTVTADQRSNEHPADRKPETSRVVNDVELGLGSPKDRIQKMLAIGLTSVGVAQAIFMIKQKSKKSWDVLGVTPEKVEQIMKLKGN